MILFLILLLLTKALQSLFDALPPWTFDATSNNYIVGFAHYAASLNGLLALSDGFMPAFALYSLTFITIAAVKAIIRAFNAVRGAGVQ